MHMEGTLTQSAVAWGGAGEIFFMDVMLELNCKGYIEIKKIKGWSGEIF